MHAYEQLSNKIGLTNMGCYNMHPIML
jgi:hypothetical protein